MLENELGGRCVAKNTSLSLREDAAKSIAALRMLLDRWNQQGRPTDADAMLHAQGGARSRVSKFQPCLPEAIVNRLPVDSLLDVSGACAVVESHERRRIP